MLLARTREWISPGRAGRADERSTPSADSSGTALERIREAGERGKALATLSTTLELDEAVDRKSVV